MSTGAIPPLPSGYRLDQPGQSVPPLPAGYTLDQAQAQGATKPAISDPRFPGADVSNADLLVKRNGKWTPINSSDATSEERLSGQEYHPPDPEFAKHTLEYGVGSAAATGGLTNLGGLLGMAVANPAVASIAKKYGIKALEGAGMRAGWDLYRELKGVFEGGQ